MGFTDVPHVKRSPIGILALILNIIPVPGVGSIIAGVSGKHNQTIIFGVLQIVLVVGPYLFLPLAGLIGFVWSVAWGIMIFMKSS